MGKPWTAMSVLLCACAGAQTPAQTPVATAPNAIAQGEDTNDQHSAHESETASAPGSRKGSTSFGQAVPKTCTASADAGPKVVSGADSVSDLAETGQTLIFEMAGIGVEFPACTPEADMRVITVSWETKDRPSPARIHPDFTRHAATIRVDHPISALTEAPLLVRLHSKRELTQRGAKLVVAVESSGECDAKNKRDRLDDGGCSEWSTYEAAYDPTTSDMVARVPALGGYRLQFGWVPTK